MTREKAVPDAPRGVDGAERSIDGKHMVRLFPDPESGTCAERFLAGRYYLGRPGLSYSGSLHPGVSVETLTQTGDDRDGDAWIFHHDSQRPHNGVDFEATFRVIRCSLPADDAGRAMAEAITSPDDDAAQTGKGSR